MTRPILTEGEVDILLLAANGYTTDEIAERTELAPMTIKNKFTRIFEKLGAVNRTHAVVLALQDGHIKLGKGRK